MNSLFRVARNPDPESRGSRKFAEEWTYRFFGAAVGDARTTPSATIEEGPGHDAV